MNYGMWLSWNNQQEGFQIPINPASIEMSDGSKGKVYDVAGLGEINVIKDIKLTEYSFSGIFPAQRYPFVTADTIYTPKTYIDYLKKWMGTKRPVRFVFTGDSFDINEAVSIESFTWKESAGRNGDIEYSLKLKKYVFYAAQKVTVNQEVVNDVEIQVIQKEVPERQNDRVQPKTYTIAGGDTLWIVAKKILGDEEKWREIQRLNNITDAEVKSLQIGRVLKLPEVVT